MVQSKHGDLCLNAQHPHRNQAWSQMPVTPALVSRVRQIPRAHWRSSLNSKHPVRERSCLKGERGSNSGRHPKFTSDCQSDTCTQTHTPINTHVHIWTLYHKYTQKQKERKKGEGEREKMKRKKKAQKNEQKG